MNYQVKIIKEKSTDQKMAVMPIEQWKAIQKELTAYAQHLQLYDDMKEALLEVKAIRGGEKESRTFQSLIDGLSQLDGDPPLTPPRRGI